jgi:TonB family protein
LARSTSTRASAKARIIDAFAKYPESARLPGATGTGFFKVRMQRKTGKVKTVTILRSTGDKELDNSAIKSLKRWRFKPGVLPSIRSIHPKTDDPFADEDFLMMVPVRFVLIRGRPATSYFG